MGQTDKAIDLDLISPVTGRKAFVQVKSQADYSTFQQSVDQFQAMGQYDDFYFVVHTATGYLADHASPDPRIHVLHLVTIADLVINAGLVRWLINKRS